MSVICGKGSVRARAGCGARRLVEASLSMVAVILTCLREMYVSDMIHLSKSKRLGRITRAGVMAFVMEAMRCSSTVLCGNLHVLNIRGGGKPKEERSALKNGTS